MENILTCRRKGPGHQQPCNQICGLGISWLSQRRDSFMTDEWFRKGLFLLGLYIVWLHIAQIALLSFQAAIPHKPRQVRWTARFSGHSVVASMFALVTPKRRSHRQLKKTPNGRRSQLNQYWSYKPRSNLNQHEFCKILYVSFKWYIWQEKSWCRYWGSTANTGSLLGIKQT